MRVDFEPAYLLSLRPYRETSQLLEAITPERGRVGLVARGARGPKARQRGTLELFRPLLLSWTESGDLGTMTGVESAGPGITLSGERVFHGWYLNELLLKLLQRHDPHPQLYGDYAATLARLAGEAIQAEAALRVFEKRLLEQLGYGLQLDSDLMPEQFYRYRAESGPIAADASEAGTYRGTGLIALRDEVLDTRSALDDARRLLRTALEPHAPRATLRTPKLLREMRGWRGAQRDDRVDER